MPRPPIAHQTASSLRQRTSGADRVRVTDRSEVYRRARGQRFSFMPYDQHFTAESQTGKTAAISTKKLDVSNQTPPGAVAAICVVNINANTATTGNVNVNFHIDSAAAGIGQCIGTVSCPMASANATGRAQIVAPIGQGGILYETTINGTVNYDLHIYVVGWVIE